MILSPISFPDPMVSSLANSESFNLNVSKGLKTGGRSEGGQTEHQAGTAVQ